jgi:hypothetical protein
MKKLILLALLLVGCATFPASVTQEEVRVRINSVVVESYGFDIRIEFLENSDLPGLIQEIEMLDKDGNVLYTLVEYFDTPGGRLLPMRVDRHSWFGFDYHKRRMFIYPAWVDGADLDTNGFAHLPRNKDGSMITNIPDRINSDYQENYETRGFVLEEDRNAGVFWSVEFIRGVLEVTLPDKSTIKLGNWVGK